MEKPKMDAYMQAANLRKQAEKLEISAENYEALAQEMLNKAAAARDLAANLYEQAQEIANIEAERNEPSEQQQIDWNEAADYQNEGIDPAEYDPVEDIFPDS